eukprot:scaffold18264_cov90-Isochrysis_galbana.AAC.2
MGRASCIKTYLNPPSKTDTGRRGWSKVYAAHHCPQSVAASGISSRDRARRRAAWDDPPSTLTRSPLARKADSTASRSGDEGRQQT